MKKIFSYALMLLFGACVFTACENDRDSNPVLLKPSEFALTGPSYADAVIDLKNSGETPFTFKWERPAYTDLGAPVAIDYSFQVSYTGDFANSVADAKVNGEPADYVNYPQVFRTEHATFTASELATYLCEAAGWDNTSVPEYAAMYVRVKAAVKGFNEVCSNTLKIEVKPFFLAKEAAPVELWYLVGNCIGDGSWGDVPGVTALKMLPIKGEEYDFATGKGVIEWIGYVNDGFKLRGDLTDGWATQWGQGGSFGEFVKNDGGSGNIQPTTEGYYRVTLNTLTDELKVEPYDGVKEFADGIAISGDLNGWTDTPMIAVNTKVEAKQNHDWYYDLTVSNADGEVFKFKTVGSWDTNWGGPSEFTSWGVPGGDNIWVPAGSYRIFFNDITGYYEIVEK